MREKFDQVMQAIGNSGGSALGKAKAVMGSFGGAVKQLGAQFGVFQIQVIESMGPLATQAVQAFTKLMAVVGGFISRNGTLVAIVAGSAAALFGLGIASLAAGIALQGLATGLRVIQAVLPLIPALFSPIALSIAAMAAAIGGGVIIARTLSPAFKQETDAIAAALMRLDFGAAWSVMNINLAIALVQMHQAFAQAFDLVKNTVISASSFIGDMLIQGLDRFMGLFGADILTLQAGFEKLGVYFRAAFDWDFAVNGMSDALKKVEARVEEARQRAPTADARAEQRRQEREKQAEGRNEEIKRRDAGFEDTIKELRKDAARARERGLGKTDKVPAEEKVDEKGKPVKPKLPAAPPGAFMPPPEGGKAEKDKGIAGAGNWSGVGLDIGPEINRLEDPANRTADATERTAEAVGAIAGKGGGEAAGVAPMAAAAGMAPGEFQAQLDAIALMAADPNSNAGDLLALGGNAAMAGQAAQAAAPPAIAMDAVAPRAPGVQQAAAQGMQAAVETSQIGIAFQKVGSEIVAAITAGTEVSKQMLSALTKIADKKPTEAVFS
jgi:hypothetical protein